jgi:hypothetical protein
VSPTILETPHPTVITKETFQPTLKKTQYPTKHVSRSVSPTHISSSVSPSHDHSESPSKPPTPFNCNAQSDGTFGTVTTDKTSSISVEYKYRLETRPSSAEFIKAQVLPPIEKALVDKLIPTFFSSCGRRLTTLSAEFDYSSLRSTSALKTIESRPEPENAVDIDSSTSAISIGVRNWVAMKADRDDHQRMLETVVGMSSSPLDIIQGKNIHT